MANLDSRPRTERHLVPLRNEGGATILGVSVHCLSCGKQDGYVPSGMPPGVMYLCGDCEARYGVPPEMIERPDLERERV